MKPALWPPVRCHAQNTGVAPADQPLFTKLDLRVGKIVDVWEHPDSEKLWCEKIDVGEAEPREIASGLRAYYGTAEEMAGRRVLVVCNLKAAKLAGFASAGMVLCASTEDRSTVAFVEPPEVGVRVRVSSKVAYVEPPEVRVRFRVRFKVMVARQSPW